MNAKGLIKLLAILFGVSLVVTVLLPLLIPMIIGTFGVILFSIVGYTNDCVCWNFICVALWNVFRCEIRR